MRVTFYGVRGSVPAPGPQTARYGGNTSCVEVRLADGSTLALDAGTGLRALGNTLINEGRDAAARIEPQMAAAIRHALGDHPGSLLAFLPGAGGASAARWAAGSIWP